ncbi:MAG: chorismate mutase [Hyphomonadaceae bacterium]|nr:chorismate mutase [Clostridia bacterium]
MNELDNMRNEIDAIDHDLTVLFEKRMQIVNEVAAYKKRNQLPVFHANREKEVIAKNKQFLNDVTLADALAQFLQATMNISSKAQRLKITVPYSVDEHITCNTIDYTKTVGFQGVEGAYGDIAMKVFFGRKVCSKNYTNFEDVFIALKNGEITYGVLPIENTSTGAIHEVTDLMRQYGFYIVGEKVVKIEHCLMAPKGATVEGLKEIYSHPQAFGQSVKYLKTIDAKLIPYYNTAQSAKMVAERGDVTKGAITSRQAADVYGLTILKENIEDYSRNATRFIVISDKLLDNEICNKMSIIVSVPNISGSLHALINYFADYQLNMFRIESRPHLENAWEYYFYIDFEGNLKQTQVAMALQHIEDFCTTFRFLGNYGQDT